MSFVQKLIRIHNSGQSRSIVVCGNIYDLFPATTGYVHLIPFLQSKMTKGKELIQIVYELNGPIRIAPEDRDTLRQAWVKWKTGEDTTDLLMKELRQKSQSSQLQNIISDFDRHVMDSIGNPTTALEFMRQLALCSRTVLKQNLFFIIEAADMLIPEGEVNRLTDSQLHRISIVYDWVSDPGFMNGNDTVVFVAESRSQLHSRIARLPQIISVDIPSPDIEARKQYIAKYNLEKAEEWSEKLAPMTAGLTLQAIDQLLKSASELTKESGWTQRRLVDEVELQKIITTKVEDFIKSQLGEDVVQFKRPTHTLDDCVGFTDLKKFIREVLTPRLNSKGKHSLSGAGVAGPIGGGKTYFFEGFAGERKHPVIVLGQIRSQWFGGTDLIGERLERLLLSIDEVDIFVDEADTQFGGLSGNVHETERRLTGKIQQLMSDPRLRGKVFWLLMTARIHMLSPDIRRPGRAGDLILPVLDPEGQDRRDFLKWALKGVKVSGQPVAENDSWLDTIEKNCISPTYSAASFSSLKGNLEFIGEFKDLDALMDEIRDFIQPAIGLTREYQRLQALRNTTRKSLIPKSEFAKYDNNYEKMSEAWEKRINELEALGIH